MNDGGDISIELRNEIINDMFHGRIERRFTQEEIAKMMGMSVRQVRRVIDDNQFVIDDTPLEKKS